MVNSRVYALDANVFIQAARQYYAFDLAPKFWDSLVQFGKAGTLCSIDRVLIELKQGKDQLASWAESQFNNAFAPTDDAGIIGTYGQIMTWVNGNPGYSGPEKARFAAGADGWLIAYCQANGHILVTHEELAPPGSSKVKIPNVCRQFSVTYIDTFTMLRSLGIQFL